MKFLLIVISDDGKEEFFGPFNDGVEALNWGAVKFDTGYTLASVPLKEPE